MSVIPYCNPKSRAILYQSESSLIDPNTGEEFPVVNSIPRFTGSNNYAKSFGFQWRRFALTQLDQNQGVSQSHDRLVATTNWTSNQLDNCSVLEVGSGAGRFTRELLSLCDRFVLYSVDYSEAVEVNHQTNLKYGNRLRLSQASLYELPFPSGAFDKVICLGVLQHTPSFDESVRSLVEITKPGGQIVVDFYRKKGWYTKIHSKYILRPVFKRFTSDHLIRLIDKNIDWMIILFDLLFRIKLGFLARFIPITDLRNLPNNLSNSERREWAILDTFDGFSPAYDRPQRLEDVISMFKNNGCRIDFAGSVSYDGRQSTVLRATRL